MTTAVREQTELTPCIERWEVEVIRGLAEQVAEIAAASRMAAIRARWRAVNGLRKPDRAPVYCRPIGCWRELLPPETLACRTGWLRGMEQAFRKILLKREIDDDTPVSPHYAVPAVFEVDPPNTWGLDIGQTRPAESDGAWAYDPPLRTESDYDKLCAPHFTYNEPATRRRLEQVSEVLGDALPVKLVCLPPLTANICTFAAKLRGLEQMMLDMALNPELMHRLMAHLRDAVLTAMDQVEATGLLTPNNEGPMFCSDPFGPAPVAGRYGYRNCWSIANSQECDQVSPAMWEEFALTYEKAIFARFGLVQYGCCENLTHKIDRVLTIPNLRVFVSSAWTDLDKVIEAVGTDYCIMWRQKATDVVFPADVSSIKAHLDEGTRKLKGQYYQLVLRELQTLAGHMDRLHVWAQLAKEAGARHV